MSVQHYKVATFTTSSSIGYLVKLAHTLMHDCASESFAEHDVSFMQWVALRRISEGLATTASDLCRAMSYDTGALTRMVDQLEERGYLTRARSVEDRRVVQLKITKAGRAKLDELTPILVDRLNETLSDFSKTEFAEFSRLLNKLIGKLQTARAGSGDAS